MRINCGIFLAVAMALAAHGEVGAEAVADDAKPLKVLSIGNSFSIGMHAALPPVAKSFGRRVDICTMFIGGCSLERHCKNLAEPESAPYKINWTWDNQLSNPVVPFAGVLADVVDAKTGKVRKMSNIPQMLRAEKWDVVTIQQASHESWKSESYHPFGDELVKAIREGAPQAKIVVQETWSYVSFCPRYAQWGIDQTEMYNRLHKCYGDFAAKYGFDVIPVGTAVQLYRRRLPVRSTDTEVGGDPVGKSPNGDSIHMNANGEYLQSLVWAGALLGVDVAECNYVPKAVSREKAAVMRECAARAVAGAKCKSGVGAAARPVPRPAMAERLANGPEIIGIVHWGLNTYTDREWGYGDEDPALLNPAKFDADQIVGACKAGGIGGLVVVAKHHDGFCLWPTKTTGHNITKSPFGRDYVKEMEQACRRAGIKFGVYCSPWDRNSVHYATDKYVEIFHAQLKELLGGAYGDVFEMWFDGANGGDGYYGGAREKRKIGAGYYRFDEVFRFVREMQFGVTIFSGSEDGSDLRWCGNERGIIDAGSRATIAGTGGYRDGKYGNPDYVSIRNVGSPDGEFFRVAEADFPLRKGWFYHEKDRGTTRSAAYLTKLYLSSVGNAATMNIGIAPNKDGLLDADDVKALSGLKTLKDALFAHEVKQGEPFNVVVMREDISRGEQVDEWEFVADGAAILHGKSIGAKRIRVLETPCVAKSCKVNVLKDGGEFQGVSFKLYRADPELVRLVLSATTESGETDTAKWMTAAEGTAHMDYAEKNGLKRSK